jgi:integrase
VGLRSRRALRPALSPPRLPAKRRSRRAPFPNFVPPLPTILGPGQRLPRYLTQIELRAFFAPIRSLRDRTLFALIYHYGLRVGEVALLQRGDVDLDRRRVVIKRLKGGVWTEQPLFSGTAALLRQHAARSRGDPSDPLFRGRRGPLKKRQIQSLFTRYRDLAHLPSRYSCHCLRHSIATHLLDAGVALEFVQDHLGHQSIRSTSIYARITDRHRAVLFQKLERSPWIVHPAWMRSAPAPPRVPRTPEGVSP